MANATSVSARRWGTPPRKETRRYTPRLTMPPAGPAALGEATKFAALRRRIFRRIQPQQGVAAQALAAIVPRREAEPGKNPRRALDRNSHIWIITDNMELAIKKLLHKNPRIFFQDPPVRGESPLEAFGMTSPALPATPLNGGFTVMIKKTIITTAAILLAGVVFSGGIRSAISAPRGATSTIPSKTACPSALKSITLGT